MLQLIRGATMVFMLLAATAHAEDMPSADSILESIRGAIASNLNASNNADLSTTKTLKLSFANGDSDGYIFTGLSKTGNGTYLATFIFNGGSKSPKEGQFGQRALIIQNGQLSLVGNGANVYKITKFEPASPPPSNSIYFLNKLRESVAQTPSNASTQAEKNKFKAPRSVIDQIHDKFPKGVLDANGLSIQNVSKNNQLRFRLVKRDTGEELKLIKGDLKGNDAQKKIVNDLSSAVETILNPQRIQTPNPDNTNPTSSNPLPKPDSQIGIWNAFMASSEFVTLHEKGFKLEKEKNSNPNWMKVTLKHPALRKPLGPFEVPLSPKLDPSRQNAGVESLKELAQKISSTQVSLLQEMEAAGHAFAQDSELIQKQYGIEVSESGQKLTTSTCERGVDGALTKKQVTWPKESLPLHPAAWSPSLQLGTPAKIYREGELLTALKNKPELVKKAWEAAIQAQSDCNGLAPNDRREHQLNLESLTDFWVVDCDQFVHPQRSLTGCEKAYNKAFHKFGCPANTPTCFTEGLRGYCKLKITPQCRPAPESNTRCAEGFQLRTMTFRDIGHVRFCQYKDASSINNAAQFPKADEAVK